MLRTGLLAFAALPVAFAGPAAAQTGGGVTADPDGKLTDPAVSGSAAAGTTKVPVVKARPKPLLITCRTACAGLDTVRPGGVVRVTGDAMDGARTVIFKGGKGGKDDTSAPAVRVAPDAVDAVLPVGAASGPVQVRGAEGAASRTTGKTITVLTPGTMALSAARASSPATARVDTGKVFFRGAHQATVSVFVPEGPPQHVVLDLERISDKAVVGHWELDAPGGTVQSVAWTGVVKGSVQSDGRYRFRIQTAAAGAAAVPTSAAFTFLGNIFPIRGTHSYGEGIARFGAGRTGHTHQGHDVFAACGTPMVAARGGKVKFAGTDGNAGNYIVIDGAGTGTDYVYMHLKGPALAVKGDTVYTGQPIGEVGDTGDASGCHLHFELWKSPGWYTGGKVFDPLPSLKRWDKQS
ncbi:endolysin [Paraconexibacter sp. AEG42_29]|uniref:Endolysin n=1 Tax=Paraconexibacter sp. AEG42_29 TaxID=2997339 RepID=A0AAU7AY15_9ACTN